MGHSSTEVIDLAPTLDRVLDKASSGLNRAAVELGAGAVAVLLAAGAQVEVTYCWSAQDDDAPPQRLSSAAQYALQAVKTRSGFVDAGSPLAELLRESLSRHAQSFLLFPWRVRQTVITVVFCFANPQPGHRDVPDVLRERLDLIGVATWSVKEIARLRTELDTVTSRLAGRKIVERAKGVLQLQQGLSEERAYQYLRGLSRRRRISMTSVAEEVVREHGGREPERLSGT
jgi:hypothetical protein